ncbi:hypothetical protein C7S18_05485 [Ahniella affigens]|uniref:Uncharacterized protein n=1 Tax=Ahniella affigens TaxID=2021234 RepID=A0A2P1PPB8_9GAMM|nr:hypothetical protein [Ahniella affigens]AVP96689.1 hypothetical protein C7S18_05485 [Ahniella affigens]
MKRLLLIVPAVLVLLVGAVVLLPHSAQMPEAMRAEAARPVERVVASSFSAAIPPNAEPAMAMRVVQLADATDTPYSPAQWPALPSLDAPVLSLFDTLKARAEQGDAGAACRLVMELEQCRELEDMRLTIERGRADQIIGQLAMIRSLEARAERARFLLNRCSGLADTHYRAAYDMTKRAAIAGHRPSLARYLSGGVFSQDLGLSIDFLEDYRTEAPRILEASVQRGSLQALSMLANAPVGSNIAIPDAVRDNPVEVASLKLLWQRVMREMQNQSNSAKQPPSDDASSLLSDVDQAAAQSLAASRYQAWFVDSGGMEALREFARRPINLHQQPDMNTQCTEGYDPAPVSKAPIAWGTTPSSP